jgi:hypothetical protein
MSKSRTLPTRDKKRVLKYPSDYGSHGTMINLEKTELLKNKIYVVCTDDRGDYITEQARLDNGLADGYRFACDEFRQSLLSTHLSLT